MCINFILAVFLLLLSQVEIPMNVFRKFVNNTHAAVMQIGAVFGLMLTGIIGAYTIPTAISSLINSTATGAGIAADHAVVPILSIVAPIAIAIGLIVVIAKSADIM